MATTEDKQRNPRGKLVTVLFSWADYELIEAELQRRTEARGYDVTLSDALRELVRENWTPST